MSYIKKDRVFPHDWESVAEMELAQMIAAALRHDCAGIPSPIKYLGRLTGCHLRAIKNWFQGRHVPSSRHLMILAAISPSVRRIVLGGIGGENYLQVFERIPLSKNVLENVYINERAVNHNPRQEWFLNILQRGFKATARSIEMQFNVSLKTAQRDISELKKKGFIAYTGARKNGCYNLLRKS